ncbi:MAG TPA: hypothetical protein VL240_07155 [Candidatus Binatia bacterium]|nr:hypothetical protein [Candidatus Binatia bacterium]
MRLNINLASQPYEVARDYRQRMTLVIGALAVLAVLLAGYIVYQRAHSRTVNRQLADVQRQMKELDREESQARATLNRPANRAIADQSEFLNELFARKALSWTHIFTEMEKIMPPNLHVVSMKPDFSRSNDLVLHMIVATDSRDRAVELVRHMETSSHFRQPQVVAETVLAGGGDQAAGGGNIQFDIAAIYVPGGAESGEMADNGTAASAEEQGPGAGNAAKAGAGAAKPNAPAANPPAALNAAQNRPVPAGRVRGH